MKLLIALLLITMTLPVHAMSPMMALAGVRKVDTFDFESGYDGFATSGDVSRGTGAAVYSGYHVTLSSAEATITLSHNNGAGGTMTFWARHFTTGDTCQVTADGSTWTTFSTSTTPTQYQVSVGSGTTTIGFKKLSGVGGCFVDHVRVPKP